MPTNYQQNFNAYVAMKAQSARGAIASGGSAFILPMTGGAMKTNVAAISSTQVRGDGLLVRGRHGSRSLTASYKGELQNTNYNTLLEAVMRTTAVTGAIITEATIAMGSATLSVLGSTFTFSAGDVRTAGIRVRDIISFTVGAAAGDINRNLRVTSLTATTIVVAETLTTVAGPVATYSFSVRGSKVINPLSGALVSTYFTIEEYEIDADVSTIAQDVRIGKLSISGQPNNMVSFDTEFVGTGQTQALATGSSPYFTAPALASLTATPYSVIDATLRLGSGDQIDLTAFTISLDTKLSAPAVVGAAYSPDVFAGTMEVSLSLSMLRPDLALYSALLAETSFSFSALLQVAGTAPLTFMSINIPYFTLGTADASAFKKDGGARTQTINIPAALIGIDPTGTGYDPTMISFQYSV